MGKITRKRHTAEFKARVALEAIKGEQTLPRAVAGRDTPLTLAADMRRFRGEVGGWRYDARFAAIGDGGWGGNRPRQRGAS